MRRGLDVTLEITLPAITEELEGRKVDVDLLNVVAGVWRVRLGWRRGLGRFHRRLQRHQKQRHQMQDEHGVPAYRRDEGGALPEVQLLCLSRPPMKPLT